MEERDDFIINFGKQLSHVNPFIQLVLNGHLEVEGCLDKFLHRVFYHPAHLENARLSFAQKVQIARSYTTESHDANEWQLILVLNVIRNKIAHRSRNKELKIKVGDLRAALLKAYAASRQEEVRKLNAADVVVNSAAICCGFLLMLEEQLAKANGEAVEDEQWTTPHVTTED